MRNGGLRRYNTTVATVDHDSIAQPSPSLSSSQTYTRARERRKIPPKVYYSNSLDNAARIFTLSVALALTFINILYHSFNINLTAMSSSSISLLDALYQSLSPPNGTRTPASRRLKTRGNGGLVVFYNVYMPKRESEHEAAKHIIQEQIEQVSTSYAAKQTAGTHHQHTENNSIITPLEIYFNTIGHGVATRIVTDACRQYSNATANIMLHCTHLRHYSDGHFEDVTLTELYDHCQHPRNVNDTVTYLHSKGTYHPSEMNDHWRRYMTKSAMSQDCVENLQSGANAHNTQQQCSVCGFNFSPVWTPAFFGNIWTAQCRYIRKLMPPRDFKKQADPTADRAMELMRQGRFGMNLLTPYLEEAGHLGRSRFADEHWVGSHPSLVPCDLAPHPHLMKWIHPSLRRDNIGKMPALSWSMAPRRPINDDWIFLEGKGRRILMVNDDDWREREFFLIRGALWKWLTWYNELPPESSYVWTWFPEGEAWLERFRSFSNSTLAMKLYLEQDDFQFPHSGNVLQEQDVAKSLALPDYTMKSSPDRVFFLHLQIPPRLDAIKPFLKTFRQRLQAISDGSPGATVWYTTVGQEGVLDPKDVSRVCNSVFKLSCHRMEHISAGMDSVTMTRVHQYCSIHPKSRLGYTFIDGSEALDGQSASFRHDQTMRMANQCWQTSSESCQICARKANTPAADNRLDKIKRYKAPAPLPSIWLATCKYIRQLEAPNEFSARMSELKWTLGKSFGKRWIFSAPEIKRCNVQADGTVEQITSAGQLVKVDSSFKALNPLNSFVVERRDDLHG